MAMKALVTGGAGFIGSHLVRGLLERGYSVSVMDSFATGRRENLREIGHDIRLIEGDLRDLETCKEACAGVDVVFHLGALGSVPRSIDNPLMSNAVNVEGTLNILVAAREAGVRRLVFSSSSSVYGDTPVLPKHEGMPFSPRSPYAVTKVAGEEYCKAFYRTYGMETVCLRYFNVFGPRQDPNSQYAAVIPKFVAALQSGRRPVIFGDGMQSRDFTHVSNVVRANILAAGAPDEAGEVFNIACSEQVSVLHVLKSIAKALGKPADPEFLPARAGDVKHSLADIRLACEKLGYRPEILFEEGLASTIQWYEAAADGVADTAGVA
jgi:nucleoside-diphosphate-sugar epimerase